MEVFKVFATLSLVDMLSGPLGKIRQAMGSVDDKTKSLHARLGQLALALGPVALGAGVLLGSFGACVSVAAGFEDQIAKVGAISRASGEDLKALETRHESWARPRSLPPSRWARPSSIWRWPASACRITSPRSPAC